MHSNRKHKSHESCERSAIRQEIMDQFEQAWQSGSQPRIDDFLPEAATYQQDVLIDLINIDLERRLKAGEDITVEDYLQRFPQLAPATERLSDLRARAAKLRSREGNKDTVDYSSSESKPDSNATGTKRPLRGIEGYDILGELGRGGMGVVYKARHLQLNRLVALKMIRTADHADEREVDRFLGEAEAVAAFSHANIVQVYDFGRHHDMPYIALEFVKGGTLADKLKGGPLPAEEAVKVVRQIAKGMNAAHQAGIVHRDLKPANILLTKRGDPKITDFGLAKKVEGGSGMTQTGAVLGTPSYMAPEQAGGEGKRVGPAADVYALGAVLYACLTGRPPFQADSVMNTLLQVMNDEPTPPRQLNGGVPRDLEVICLKCLAKDPLKRYASAHDLADDLECWQDGVPITARPVGRTERVVKWVKRNPVIAGLAALVFMVLIVGIGVSSYFALEATRRANSEADAKKEAVDAQKEEAKARGEEARARKKAEAASKRAENSEKDALWHLYRAQLFPIREAHEKGEFGELELLLEEAKPKPGKPDYRGWEWYYYLDQCRQASKVIKNPEKYWTSAWCSTTRQVAVVAAERTIIMEIDGYKPIRSLPHPSSKRPVVLEWHPDGTCLAARGSGQNGREITIWDVKSGKITHTISNPPGTAVLSWSPNGRLIATGSDNGLRIWDWKTRKCVQYLELQKEPYWNATTTLAWHPDSTRLAMTYRGGYVVLWDIKTGRRLFVEHLDETGLCWSPDGKKLATSTKIVNELGKVIGQTPGHTLPASYLSWSPDGKFLLSGGHDQTIRIWDVHKMKQVDCLTAVTEGVGNPSWVKLPLFWDYIKGQVHLMKHDSCRIISTAAHPEKFERLEMLKVPQVPYRNVPGFLVHWSPDGKRIVASERFTYVWDAKTMKL